MTDYATLINEQKALGDAINNLLVNFQKANQKRRRNPEFLKSSHDGILEAVAKFNGNNDSLQTMDDKSHDYFTQNYYLKVLERYNRLWPVLLDVWSEKDRDLSGGPSQEIDELTLLLRKQRFEFGEATNFCGRMDSQFENENFRMSTEDFGFYLNKLEKQSVDLKSLHKQIAELVSYADEHASGYSKLESDEMEKSITDWIDFLIVRRNQLNVNTSPAPKQEESQTFKMNAPNIEVPAFDGTISKWPQFRDLFNDCIHMKNYPDSYKFAFLKSKLVGKASSLISIMNTSADNYTAAWDRISQKYENKKIHVFDAYDRLFNQKMVKDDNAGQLREFHDVSKECISILKAYAVDFAGCESAIVYLLISKLDGRNRELYEQSLTDCRALPKFEEFFNFLDKRCHTLQVVPKTNKQQSAPKPPSSQTVHLTTLDACPSCGQTHRLYECLQFRNLNRDQRWNLVNANKLCCNCLRPGHSSKECSYFTCGVPGCGRKHNTLLHYVSDQKKGGSDCPKKGNTNKKHHRKEKSNSTVATSVQLVPKPGECVNITNQQSLSSSISGEDKFIFLGTAKVYIEDADKNKILCRALLDGGSQVNLITKRLASKLKLKQSAGRTKISGIGNSVTVANKVTFTLSSSDCKYSSVIEASIMPEITSYGPSENIDLHQFDDYNLADPAFNNSDPIDVLIGNELITEWESGSVMRLEEGMPSLKETELGWVVIGKYVRKASSNQNFCGISVEEDFTLNAPTLWELEDFSTKSQLKSIEEELAEQHFNLTTKRHKGGKFVVDLPKSNEIKLGSSYEIASRRLKSLEKRFARDPSVFKPYHEFLDEYLKLGHMEKVSANQIPKLHYFLPHHPVMKESSTTTKLRVVFDGSCKTSNNISLNDILLKGPTVQSELFDILLRFRSHRYAMSGDIEKMYRQVMVSEKDQYLQMILWRNSPNEDISCYKLTTLTYGTKSAPYLATKCLSELSHRNLEQFPVASRIIKNDFYIDDLLSGADDLQEAKQIQSDLISILKRGGFNLRKWCSNEPSLLINSDDDSILHLNYKDENGSSSARALGINWDFSNDTFSIAIPSLDQQAKLTKRQICSEAGQVFDPLGILSPCTVIAKLVIQELWKCKLDWDAKLPDDLTKSWLNYRSQLPLLKSIAIRRHAIIGNYKTIQLIGFADASKKAYGAVLYIRSIDFDDNIQVSFLCAKSKLCPIPKDSTKDTMKTGKQRTPENSNPSTIPKLELSAAKLLAEMVHRVKQTFNKTFDNIYLWSDSNVVLSWIQKSPNSFKQFVANRIRAIQELTAKNDWHHVDGDQNPADIVSRGMLPKDLKESKLWFEGPEFLMTDETSWFTSTSNLHFSDIEDLTLHVLVASDQKSDDDFLININHRNSFLTLKRIFAYLLRFIKNCKSSKELIASKKQRYQHICQLESEDRKVFVLDTLELSALEIVQAEEKLCFCLQKINNMEAEMDKSLKRLSPFKDSEGLIRVGGRLQSSKLPYDAKHPILLPHSPITKLLLLQLHRDNFHAAPLTLLSIARERFWPMKGKRTCSQIFHECIRCFMIKPKDIHQLMGSLPPARVIPEPAFTHTGVDYAGPLMVHYNIRGKRPTKSYLAVFVCFVTKACHFELVSDLTSVAFLECLRRFIARRGKPLHIYSDNATNFVGAKEELKRLAEFFEKNSRSISKFSANKGIVWTTIPARSPHFGGLWESSVKRAKFHIKDLVNNAQLTFEQLNTVIIEVEAIVNSRPITALSENPNDLHALTPAHFINPGRYSLLPEKDLTESRNHLLTRYEMVCKISQQFWIRFSKEYLSTLQSKSKWTKTMKNVEPNTLVLLKDSNLPPLRWKRGRVVNAFKGNDGLVRVLEVKTENGLVRRAVTEVAPLPLAVNDDIPETLLDSVSTNLCIFDDNIRNSFKKSDILKFLILLFSLVFTLPSVYCENDLKITKFSHHPGLYFDGVGKIDIVENSWHIITYYNLSNFWFQYEHFQKSLRTIIPLCNALICKSSLEEIHRYLQDIHRLNDVIRKECQLRDLIDAKMMNRTRSKRSVLWKPLNLLGNIANKFTGVLDSEYAENMEKVIAKIKRNEDRQMILIKSQTTILDNTVKVMKQNNNEIIKRFNELQAEIKANVISSISQSQQSTMNTALVLLVTEVFKYRETQLQIHNVLVQFKHGKLNPLLISPEELNDHLSEIQKVLGPYQLPSSSFAELQDIAEVAVTYGKYCLMFNIEIPLLNMLEFNLYRIAPLPNFHLNKFVFIKPITEYMAINVQSQSYYMLTNEDIKDCKQFHNILICNEHHPIYSINEENHCEVNLFLHDQQLSNVCDVRSASYPQFWIELQSMNSWLYAVKNNISVKLICKNEISSYTLFDEGIVDIPAGCTLSTNGLRIHGKNVTLSHLLLQKIPSVLPPINFTKSFELRNTSTPVILKLNDMNFISESIKDLKALETATFEPFEASDYFNQFNNVDVHQQVSYVLFSFIFLIGIIICIIVYCRRKSVAATTGTAITLNVPAPISSSTSKTGVLPQHDFTFDETKF